jgi:ABC-type multidrug transport system fused ATPase/permease subunit
MQSVNRRHLVRNTVIHHSLKLGRLFASVVANIYQIVISVGELINLMQVDATKIEMFIPQFHVLWDGALQIIGYMAILYTLIGWPCFAGMGIMLCAGPVQGVVMGKLFGLNREMVKHTDARVESTNEGLQGIQCVKMYTWEESLAKAITKNREEELKLLKKVAYLRGFSKAYMGALPGIVAVGSFVVFALSNSNADVSAATLFSALVAFDQLRFPLLFYPVSLAQLAQAKVSAARVELFLGLKEISRAGSIESGQYTRNEDAKGEIVVKDATVYWDDPNEPIDVTEHEGSSIGTMSSIDEEDASSVASSAEDPKVRYPKASLKKVTLRVSPGELCAVVGRVASGKTTLCSAILNEALLESGDIALNGKVAYAAQSPWILNATLRDNIIFGLPMDQAKYDRVIKACQLEHDLTMFDDGDLTEIGERGINLSGGQKARVSIARAAYSDADTIILDDPLSALDPEVGKLLFDECILDLMEGKTRLFVTNQIQFLRFCDTVVALKRGEVAEHGTFTDLVANEKGEVKRLLADSSSGQKASQKKSKTSGKESESGDGEKAAQKVDDKKAKALTTKEEQMIGGVSSSVYKNYMKAGGGYLKFGFVYFGFVLSCLNQVATTSWISYWTSDAKYEKHSQAFYLGIFFMLAVTLGLVTFVRSFMLVRFGIDASEMLHRNLLNSIMRAPQSFFDTTPLGRILSRFSKDFYSIDIELTDYFDFFLFTTLQVIFVLGSVVFVTPWFGIAILPMGVIYFKILNYFREVARSTKRLDSISRSPVYVHFSEVCLSRGW